MADVLFINEIHYDNAGTDTGEAVEVAGTAGLDLTGWSLVFYNGTNPGAAVTYRSQALSGIIDDEGSGFGAVSFSFPTDGIQNGGNDGVALVRPDGTVAQLLSYEGVFTASNGPAAGMTSTDIGVAETSTTAAGLSLQFTGTDGSSGTWLDASASSFGMINAGQTFAPAQPGSLEIADASAIEGDAGTSQIEFTVTRTGGSSGAISAEWSITFGTTDAADLAASQPLSGSVNFADGATTATVLVTVSSDTTFEPDETFAVTLSNPTGGATIMTATATGTILNDDPEPLAADAIFINEIHYDDAGADIGEAVEIAGPAGTDLTGWSLVLYNGSVASAAVAYSTVALGGTIDDEGNGYGAVSFPTVGIQNGGNDGLALVRPDGTVVQLLSYEGVFTASNGPAAGMTSTDIGVTEAGATADGSSLQLVGNGTTYSDFTWAPESLANFGTVNSGQTFGTPPEVQPGTLSIGDASVSEGDSGTTEMVFTVTRAEGSDGAVSADWSIVFGTADAADLGAAEPLTGSVSFADGAMTAQISVTIAGDMANEPNETFTVNLANPSGGAVLGDASATGTIINDDLGPVANVFINEFHYDNAGTDAGEAIEVAGRAGTDLTGWTIVLYNGNGGTTYGTPLALSGTIPDQQNGYGTVSVPAPGLQNGAPDGFALVDGAGRVVQFLSYEGGMTATNGPAAGLASTAILASEEPAPPIGQSLQLVGTGSSYADFTWADPASDSFGAINAGQTFLSDTGPAQIRVADAAATEGDSGTANMVFTVSRAGGLAASNSVDFQVVLDGTASADDLAAGAIFAGTVSFAEGEFAKQVVVPIAGDTIGEGNETFSVVLSNLTGNGTITDANATGTIFNDDPIDLKIYEIQGAGHTSQFQGQPVSTTGIVTAVDSNGFYLQDPTGDGDTATSDAIFVFTGVTPTVQVGDAADVQGMVTEFTGSANALSITEIINPTVIVTSSGNALPEAVLIGTGGVLPPAEWIDDDGLAVFDPQNDGLDFWESLEGMRVTLDNPLAVSNTSGGATDVVVSGGVGATGVNDRGGITVSPNENPGSKGDFNPEKVTIFFDTGIDPATSPAYSIGDGLSSVTGVVNYFGGSYEVAVTSGGALVDDVTLARESTTLRGDANHLSIATFNVENLDPTDTKFDILAGDIVYSLGAPDILALQEIQDADGAGSGSNLSGAATAQGLIDSIFVQSGLRYEYVEIAPSQANTTGGEPNGNIRNGYLYNVDRVDYVAGSADLITGSAFANSRSPLAATFLFNGTAVTAINVHFTSRGGSDPLQGANQPPNDAGDGARFAQAAAVKAYVNDHLADDPSLNFAVLGDFNGFYFEDAQTQLTDLAQGGVFTNLAVATLPEEERYSFIFDGNSQLLDNILVTGGLAVGAQYDAVHINAEFSGSRPTDHDPQVALLRLNNAPTDLALSNASVAENLPAGTVVGTLSASDTLGDTLSYALIDDAGGLFAVDPATGVVTTTAPLDFEALAGYSITGQATDSVGGTASAVFAIAVTDVDEAPIAVGDSVAVDEDATTPNLWTTLLANDNDPEGLPLTIGSVDTTGTFGNVQFDAATQTLRYVADNDAFDALEPGQSVIDRFSYTAVDASGQTSTALVEITVNGVVDGKVIIGTFFRDTLVGTQGDDRISGLFGNDILSGLGGNDLISGGLGNDVINGNDGDDVLFGDVGNDTIYGGTGNDIIFGGLRNDTLYGGSGADMFHFGRLDGNDTIVDFNVAEDRIVLDDGQGVTKTKVSDTNRDGIADLTLSLSGGASVTLLGVGQASAVQYAAPDQWSNNQPGIGGALDTFGDWLFDSVRLSELGHGF